MSTKSCKRLILQPLSSNAQEAVRDLKSQKYRERRDPDLQSGGGARRRRGVIERRGAERRGRGGRGGARLGGRRARVGESFEGRKGGFGEGGGRKGAR